MKKTYLKPTYTTKHIATINLLMTSIGKGDDTGDMEGPIIVDAREEQNYGSIWDQEW